MLLESLLAYLHIASVLGVVVFMTSEAALCRIDWMNPAVVQRLVRVDALYLVSAIAVLVTGGARTVWGIKGLEWYWTQPLLYAKVAGFVVIAAMSVRPTLMFLRWRRSLLAGGALPPAAEVKEARRWVMIESHLLVLIPLAAALLARGVATV